MSSITRCDGCGKDITAQSDHGMTGRRADGMDKKPDGTDIEIPSVEARAQRIPSGQIDLCVPCTRLAFSVLPRFQSKTREERFNERVQEAFAPLASLAQNANKGAEALANALMTSGEKHP
ncbi:hypothetical protein AB0J28_00770 [Streptosporangium canum]|uniref:hypothetical protein n=1 Tax=Streptosporangium canum TaxID=324952 RepID=UPI003423944B